MAETRITDLPSPPDFVAFKPGFAQRFLLTVDTEEEFDWTKPLAREEHTVLTVARLELALPASLAAMTDDTLFEAGVGAVPQVISAGVFGAGFALRLARAEARAAGGDLVRKGDKLRLTLPGLTLPLPGHTHSADGDSVGSA